VSGCTSCSPPEGDSDGGPCASVTCGSNETCIASASGVSCGCAEGYYRCDTGCISAQTACHDDVTDSGITVQDAGATDAGENNSPDTDSGMPFTDGGTSMDGGIWPDAGTSLEDSGTGGPDGGDSTDAGPLALVQVSVLSPIEGQVFGLGEVVQLEAQVSAEGTLPENLTWS